MTGSFTDIGVYLGRYVMGDKTNIWRVQILVALVFSFGCGASIGEACVERLGKYQLLVSSIFSFLLCIAYILYAHYRQPQVDKITATAVMNNGKNNMTNHDSITRNSTLCGSVSRVIETAKGKDIEMQLEDARQREEELLEEDLEAGGVGEEDENDDDEVVNPLSDAGVAEGVGKGGNSAYGKVGTDVNDHDAILLSPQNITSQPTSDKSTEQRRENGNANDKIYNSIVSPFHQNTDVSDIPTTVMVTTLKAPPKAMHLRDPREFTFIVIGAMLLALNGGMANSLCALSARALFVSHLTGSLTKAGMTVASQDYGFFSIYVTLITCFTSGSIIVGTMVPSSVFKFGISYFRVLFLASTLYFIAAMISIHDDNSLYFYYFACGACGVQNAIVTRYGGGVLRTTQTTGAFTDIGGTLGRMATGHYTDAWQLKVLIPITVSFIIGGTFGGISYEYLKEYSMLVNAIFMYAVTFVYLLYLRYFRNVQVTFVDIIFGMTNPLKRFRQ